ncbi:MAG: amidohydrolase [Burkholderiales bacterium RIFCSPHIGHO2_12_FULL_69_20]|nr:MAG: amidohydrolase [Burkholderiales bacterium RIFCSPHIGHO2_12_FULL_69_20]
MNARTDLPALAAIRAIEDEMLATRHQIHANPELGFEELATSDLVAERLQRWGYAVHRGLGKTGVVGTLVCGDGQKRLGIRADMDALPIVETSGRPWASRVLGKMHACGHDGHTTMLLGAARHLAATRAFNGTLHVVFQPAEEGMGGARVMIEDGFFEQFPCDAMFALHNMPGLPEGQFGFITGPAMASSDSATITVRGKGGHGAMPQAAVDPVVAASAIVMALQTIVSRNVPPLDMGIITVGAFHSGTTFNVIPETAELKLTIRALRPEVRDQLERRIKEVVHAQASVYGATAEVQYDRRYPVLVNDAESTDFARQVARDWVGEAGMVPNLPPLTGSEDFSFFLEKCKGSYLLLGNGVGAEGGCMVHNPGYDFNDRCLGTGASYWVRLAQAFLV